METIPSSSSPVSANPSNVDAGGGSESSISNHMLKSLNKSSYKISKPPTNRAPTSNPNPNPQNPNPNPNPQNPNPNPNPNPNGQPQPPVYNIDKSNFREIVQKLTGSPAHAAAPPPPPPSRLHRIRPPPLAHLSAPRPHPVGPAAATVAPFSPLPPLPTVSAAAESPITAYMRRLRGGSSPTNAAPPPLSPLGFGCMPPSPAYGMMLSPTSPRMPAPSPR